MRNKILILLTLCSFTLLSCSKNVNAIRVTKNYDVVALKDSEMNILDNITYDVNEEKILDMMEKKGSFLLYEYSPHCSVCENVKNSWKGYLKKNPITFYSYNVEKNSHYELLHNASPKYFEEQISTPHLFVIKDGIIKDEINNTKITSSNLFNSAVDSFIKTSKVSEVRTLRGYEKYLEDHDDHIIYQYDSKDPDSYRFYLDTIEKNEECLIYDINNINPLQ